jgi:hypothetical protein
MKDKQTTASFKRKEKYRFILTYLPKIKKYLSCCGEHSKIHQL